MRTKYILDLSPKPRTAKPLLPLIVTYGWIKPAKSMFHYYDSREFGGRKGSRRNCGRKPYKRFTRDTIRVAV